MSCDRKKSRDRYEEIEEGYLEKRQLRRSAGWVLLWALGLGGVSGEFSGWNFGLGAGGFGGLLLAKMLMAAEDKCFVGDHYPLVLSSTAKALIQVAG